MASFTENRIKWDFTKGVVESCLSNSRQVKTKKIIRMHTGIMGYPVSISIDFSLMFVQKAFLLGFFPESLFSEGLITGRNFAFQIGLDWTIKTT